MLTGWLCILAWDHKENWELTACPVARAFSCCESCKQGRTPSASRSRHWKQAFLP